MNSDAPLTKIHLYERRTMARHHLNRKLRTYQALYGISRTFAAISRHIRTLEQAGFLPVQKLNVFRGLTLELQSQIAHDIVDRMHKVEDTDMFRYGKTRIGWEHHLNPERPAFRQQ